MFLLQAASLQVSSGSHCMLPEVGSETATRGHVAGVWTGVGFYLHYLCKHLVMLLCPARLHCPGPLPCTVPGHLFGRSTGFQDPEHLHRIPCSTRCLHDIPFWCHFLALLSSLHFLCSLGLCGAPSTSFCTAQCPSLCVSVSLC